MAQHSIDTALWNDPRFRRRSKEAKLLYLYVITCPVGNAAGLFRIDPEMIEFHTGITPAELPDVLKSLDALHIHYDGDVIWAQHFLEHQTKSPFYLKAVAKAVDTISSPLTKEFKDFYEGWDIPYTDRPKPKRSESNDVPYDEIVSLFKRICPRPFPQPEMVEGRKITEVRRKGMGRVWKEYPDLNHFAAVFQRVANSDFLAGNHAARPGQAKAWRADFDWLIDPKNFSKVMEGKYDNQAQVGRTLGKAYTRPESLRAGSGAGDVRSHNENRERPQNGAPGVRPANVAGAELSAQDQARSAHPDGAEQC